MSFKKTSRELCFTYKKGAALRHLFANKVLSVEPSISPASNKLEGNCAYSLPSSQSTDTFRISAKAFNSTSDTGRF